MGQEVKQVIDRNGQNEAKDRSTRVVASRRRCLAPYDSGLSVAQSFREGDSLTSSGTMGVTSGIHRRDGILGLALPPGPNGWHRLGLGCLRDKRGVVPGQAHPAIRSASSRSD